MSLPRQPSARTLKPSLPSGRSLEFGKARALFTSTSFMALIPTVARHICQTYIPFTAQETKKVCRSLHCPGRNRKGCPACYSNRLYVVGIPCLWAVVPMMYWFFERMSRSANKSGRTVFYARYSWSFIPSRPMRRNSCSYVRKGERIEIRFHLLHHFSTCNTRKSSCLFGYLVAAWPGPFLRRPYLAPPRQHLPCD